MTDHLKSEQNDTPLKVGDRRLFLLTFGSGHMEIRGNHLAEVVGLDPFIVRCVEEGGFIRIPSRRS